MILQASFVGNMTCFHLASAIHIGIDACMLPVSSNDYVAAKKLSRLGRHLPTIRILEYTGIGQFFVTACVSSGAVARAPPVPIRHQLPPAD